MESRQDTGNTLWRIVRDRRLWLGPAPWIVLVLVWANVRIADWVPRLAEARKANLTSGDVGAYAAEPRFDTTFGEDPLSSWKFIPDATRQPFVALCGMSQMFCINDREPGDQTISEEMDDRLASRGVRVYGLAAPNLCTEEALFLLLALLERPETTPRAFLYGACFDKLRNEDLRPGYREFLRAHPALQTTWSQVVREHESRFPLAVAKLRKSVDEIQAASQQADESLEGKLRGAIGKFVPAVSARKELNGYVQHELFLMRNALLGIKPTSKRPIIRSRYETNRQLLELMMEICQKSGVQFIVYVIPLNPLSENPYIPEEYAAFKQWLQELASQRQIPFANLEDVVPSEDWGEFMGGPDFKHFRGAGHRRTASRLIDEFGPLLAPPVVGAATR